MLNIINIPILQLIYWCSHNKNALIYFHLSFMILKAQLLNLSNKSQFNWEDDLLNGGIIHLF